MTASPPASDAPRRAISPIQAYLESLHRRLLPLSQGEVARYIPELAKADPSRFGIVIATVDGQVYEVGDSRVPFTIQSISKPLVYGVALEDCGPATLERTVGVEPSGEAFNSISLEPGTGRPLNPMINAGAIAVSSLVPGADGPARLARVLGAISAYAGRPLQLDEAVFQSERATGHRNRAIGHLLRNYDIVGDDPEAALDLYFQQCSVLLDCRDLALIAATLANGGVNPVTGQRAVAAGCVTAILSVMTTCGVYDFTGEWVFRVGLPAKSGVGGGIMAVLPGQLGVAVYSPALDERGNSVRGVKACEAISAELGLHFLQPPRPAASALRARHTLAALRSKRRRSPAEHVLLDRLGQRALVFELQGDLRFATVEPVVREIVRAGAPTDPAQDEHAGVPMEFAVLDFRRVAYADAAATRMLAQLVACCAARGQHLVFTRVRRSGLLADFSAELDPHCARAVSFQPQLDLGLEWCERGLLQRHGTGAALASACTLAEHRLCAGVSAADLALLGQHVQQQSFEPGAVIVRSGDIADTLFLVLRGEVSVAVQLPGGGYRRLSTLSAGMSFGETALTHCGVRSADVRADTPVLCATLSTAAFAQLEQQSPQLCLRLLQNALRGAMETAVRLTADVAALEA
jgi:glutaminase